MQSYKYNQLFLPYKEERSYRTIEVLLLGFLLLTILLILTLQGVSLDDLEVLRVIYGIFPTYRDR